MNVTLRLGLDGPDRPSLWRALATTELAGRGLPQTLTIDDKPRKVTATWLDTALSAKRTAAAEWDDEAGRLSFLKGHIVKLTRFGYDLDSERLLSVLSDVPFTIGSNGPLYGEWKDGSLGEVYEGPSFAELHWSHGWSCFFRGAGHERLVSRRWLDYGPWKTRRGANDTTLVEFHELGLDPAAALAKARIGHERMGISPTGGFLQGRYVYAYDFAGKYHPAQRKLEIVVIDREVTQREMLDACAARYYQLLGPEKPLDNIAYVFMEEAPARAHVHELWLRGLECRTIIKSAEVDLTATYKP